MLVNNPFINFFDHIFSQSPTKNNNIFLSIVDLPKMCTMVHKYQCFGRVFAEVESTVYLKQTLPISLYQHLLFVSFLCNEYEIRNDQLLLMKINLFYFIDSNHKHNLLTSFRSWIVIVYLQHIIFSSI